MCNQRSTDWALRVAAGSKRNLWSAGVASLLLAAAGCSSDAGAMTSDFPAAMQPSSPPPSGVAGGAAASPTAAAGSPASTVTGAAGRTPVSNVVTAGTVSMTAGTGTAGSAGGVATSDAGSNAMAGAQASAAGSSGSSASGGAGASGTSAAGTGGAAGASGYAGAMGSAGAAGSGSEAHEDQGQGDGKDVVLIGDSWMSNTLQFEGTGGGIAPSLISLSGQRYPNYGVQGVMLLMADSFGPAIPTQWDDAKRVNKSIQTVVMSGGGNDIIQGSSTLQGSCSSGGDECKQKLVAISDALDKLWTQMATDGVKDIVYIRYSDATGSLHESLQGDKGLPPPKVCSSGKVRCHAILTTDLVAKSDLALDGIHPLKAANDRIAKRIIDLMMKEGTRR